MDVETARRQADAVIDAVGSVVVADQEFLRTILIGALSRGHVLIEDVPGTGKTLTARSFATALGLEFSRIQFTPDLLPTDLTGTNVYDESTGSFEFQPGPVFANVVLADEINRAPPKTQSALLEAMEEGQVTADGETRELPEPFFVLATQNPVEQEGTFRLPEAQVDRFIVKTSMGYPDWEGEMTLLDRREARTGATPTVEPVVDRDTVLALQSVPETVTVDRDIKAYVLELTRATRGHPQVEVGVSPRGVQRLFEVVRTQAVLSGREFVVPDDVKAVAVPALAHRLVLTTEAQVRSTDSEAIIREVLDSVDVPSLDGEGE